MSKRPESKPISIEEIKKRIAWVREENIARYDNDYKDLPTLEQIKEHFDVVQSKNLYFLTDKITGEYLHTFRKCMIKYKDQEFICYKIEGYILPTNIDMFVKIANGVQYNNQDKYAIVGEDFTDFYKSDNNKVCLFDTFEEATTTLGIGEWDKAYVVQIKYQYNEEQ